MYDRNIFNYSLHNIFFSFLSFFFLPEPLSLLELFHSINTSDTVHKPQIASVGVKEMGLFRRVAYLTWSKYSLCWLR